VQRATSLDEAPQRASQLAILVSPLPLELTAALARDSTHFARLWHAQAVDVPQFQVKRLRHAALGAVELTYAPLRPRGVADDLSVVVYS
jgi:hypothetical protein